MNVLLAVILSGSIAIWRVEPMPVSHVALYELYELADKKPVMAIPQKHEWTVELKNDRLKNRKARRKKK